MTKKTGTDRYNIYKMFNGKRYKFTDMFLKKSGAKTCAKSFREEYHYHARVVPRKANEKVTVYDVYIRKMKGYDRLGKITYPRRVVHRV